MPSFLDRSLKVLGTCLLTIVTSSAVVLAVFRALFPQQALVDSLTALNDMGQCATAHAKSLLFQKPLLRWVFSSTDAVILEQARAEACLQQLQQASETLTRVPANPPSSEVRTRYYLSWARINVARGTQARQRSDFVEAIRFLSTASKDLEKLDSVLPEDQSALAHLRLRMNTELGNATADANPSSRVEASNYYAKARTFAASAGAPLQGVVNEYLSAVNGEARLSRESLRKPSIDEAKASLERSLALAEDFGLREHEAYANGELGAIHLSLGRLSLGRRDVRAARAHWRDAERYCRKSSRLWRDLWSQERGDRAGWFRANLLAAQRRIADVAFARGELQPALQQYNELLRATDLPPRVRTGALLGRARVLSSRDHCDCLGAGEALRDALAQMSTGRSEEKPYIVLLQARWEDTKDERGAARPLYLEAKKLFEDQNQTGSPEYKVAILGRKSPQKLPCQPSPVIHGKHGQQLRSGMGFE